MLKLYIDDMRRPFDASWDLVKDTASAIEYVSMYGWQDEISFDYCLADGKTIMPFIEWFIEQDKKQGGTFIPVHFKFDSHSSSLSGTKEIIRVLGTYLKTR
jgi:hypothetical protein